MKEYDITIPEGERIGLVAIRKEFIDNGFNITMEALRHNYEAWCCDLKSGYRDEENGYHLFSPCGCNPLSFRASELNYGCTWQTTYEC
jgi:hypothetical protein